MQEIPLHNEDSVLKNIMAGDNAQESDVGEAKTKGEKILSSITGTQLTPILLSDTSNPLVLQRVNQ